MKLQLLIIFIAVGALASCQHSENKRFYLLSPINNISNQAAIETSKNIQLGIGPVEHPEYLNRLPIIMGTTDNVLAIAPNESWGEPLEKGIARVIGLNIMHMNSEVSTIAFPWRAENTPAMSLRIHIQELSNENQLAKIEVNWELVATKTKLIIIRNKFIASSPIKNSPQSLAQGYSILLGQLSTEINNAVIKAKL